MGRGPSWSIIDVPKKRSRKCLPAGLSLAGGQARTYYESASHASKFTPSNNGTWLAPLTCIGGDNTGKFRTAAHIRSIRFDFEKSPKEVLQRTRQKPEDQENDTMSSYMGRDDGHLLYDVDEWRFLASHVSDGTVSYTHLTLPTTD